jgi:hypothetical protein
MEESADYWKADKPFLQNRSKNDGELNRSPSCVRLADASRSEAAQRLVRTDHWRGHRRSPSAWPRVTRGSVRGMFVSRVGEALIAFRASETFASRIRRRETRVRLSHGSGRGECDRHRGQGRRESGPCSRGAVALLSQALWPEARFAPEFQRTKPGSRGDREKGEPVSGMSRLGGLSGLGGSFCTWNCSGGFF